MIGPPPEEEEEEEEQQQQQQEEEDFFLGPLNSNPPVHSATLNKRGSGWWSDLLPNNPRHASLQFLPSQQTTARLRQSLPVDAYRVVSSGRA